MTAMPTDALTCPRCGTPARPHCTDRACGWAFCAGCTPGRSTSSSALVRLSDGHISGTNTRKV